MEIEWLILGDFAQVVNNKLYLQGGGWDRFTVNTGFPVTHQVGIAASVLVPWNETNQEAHLEIEVQSDDGSTIGRIEGGFKVGRPPDLTPGQNQRTQIAANVRLELKEPGVYAIIGRLDGQELKRTQFNVVKGPALQAREQAAGGGKAPN
jgi:hypothetical protein